jgi:hypothetical protein
MTAPISKTNPTVPYVPFKTFIAVLDSFCGFLPDKVDVTLWPSYSGGTKSQLLSALKFLGLISDAGVPSAQLRKMSEHKDARPGVLKEVLEQSYSALFSLDLAKTTPGSFDKVLRDEYKQDGETHRKAAAFFLTTAKYAGISLSPPLTAKGRLMPMKKRNGAPRVVRPTDTTDEEQEQPLSTGPRKMIVLSNGVTLTLTASVDSFQMVKEDRAFVFALLGQMEEYESMHSSDSEEVEDEESQ